MDIENIAKILVANLIRPLMRIKISNEFSETSKRNSLHGIFLLLLNLTKDKEHRQAK